MTVTKLGQVTTPNILEVCYLLDRHHSIINVTTQAGWPYGIEELAVTLEGEGIDLDHHCFLNHGEFRDLSPLAKAFAAVQAVIDSKSDDAAFEARP